MTDRGKPPSQTERSTETQAFIEGLRGKRPPAARRDAKPPADASVAQFVASLRSAAKPGAGPGRLIFAMDATASREPTWDLAQHIQARMFEETAALGGLSVQLAWYRGMAEFEATPWVESARALVGQMTGVSCRGGRTQIEAVLRHVIGETRARRVNALVFVGDCMEEDIDHVCQRAGELGLSGVPAFLFQEGDDVVASRAFAEIARLTGGAHCHFDASSPEMLRDLLAAVAVFAAGGRVALAELADRRGGAVLRISRQMR